MPQPVSYLALSLLTLSCLLVVSLPAPAQESIKNLEVKGGDKFIQITYDLLAAEAGLSFTVTPYYLDSLGSKHKIQKAEGDLGANVSAGQHKSIRWYYHRELTSYRGSMQIELTYQLIPPYSSVFLAKKEYKRKAKLALNTSYPSEVSYDIIDSKRRVHSRGKLPAKQTDIRLPKLALDEEYRIRFWQSEQQAAYSSHFRAKRRFSLGLRAVGIGLSVAAFAYFILKPEENNELPMPFTLDD